MMDQAPKTYKVRVFASAGGTYNTTACKATYEGTRPSPYARFFDSSAGGNVTSFLTKEGRQVYTNLPVIIEEE